ncbi:MAG: DUF4915 domain-containing protein [Coleofasciculus sp. C1-SOL-03]|jgi:uncharacterized protein (TIGR03032 family)|uniref:DUF4915 domain-containing protein n=1 Tax=Coleofasciculus sp. C1-SOL-03 TaxID=3069522 RepID=UPI0032FB96FF
MIEIPHSQKSGLGITASHQLTSWLREQNLSLACTTYQTNRLFFISGQANGRLKVHERLFDKPMGLYGLGENLYMTSRYQLWHFSNLLRNGEHYRQCDRLYVPRTAYTTGDVNAHEVVVDDSQNIIFVNTDFSCLATLSPDYSFVPLWQPPFISQLVAQDRCHLNSLGQGDQLGLTNGVTFNDLFFQGNEIRYNGQTLAMLNGINTSTLTEDAFISI